MPARWCKCPPGVQTLLFIYFQFCTLSKIFRNNCVVRQTRCFQSRLLLLLSTFFHFCLSKPWSVITQNHTRKRTFKGFPHFLKSLQVSATSCLWTLQEFSASCSSLTAVQLMPPRSYAGGLFVIRPASKKPHFQLSQNCQESIFYSKFPVMVTESNIILVGWSKCFFCITSKK